MLAFRTRRPALLYNSTDDRNIPWGVGDCREEGTRCLKPGTYPKGSLVCYPIDFDGVPRAEIAEPWEAPPRVLCARRGQPGTAPPRPLAVARLSTLLLPTTS